ncbi:MAG: helix-turn-helix transcriptional regulator [Clostridium sp.]|nr:helix-turn-helix transcriptional regulator [Clostridium sp.]
MKIKDILKENGITLTYLARKLCISRPTLDSYISSYEEKGSIPNSRYQIVFDDIFNQDNFNIREFHEKVERYSRLLKRESLMGMEELDIDESDMLSDLFFQMIEDVKEKKYSPEIYSFISLMIKSYRKLDVFIDLSNYFLIINLMKELEELNDKDEKLMSVYYNFFAKLNDREKVVSSAKDSDLLKLKERIKERKIQAKNNEKELKKNLENLINEKLANEKAKGVDISGISIDELLDLLR